MYGQIIELKFFISTYRYKDSRKYKAGGPKSRKYTQSGAWDRYVLGESRKLCHPSLYFYWKSSAINKVVYSYMLRNPRFRGDVNIFDTTHIDLYREILFHLQLVQRRPPPFTQPRLSTKFTIFRARGRA